MAVRLGINPLTWTNDDLPSLGADTSLQTCLAEGKQAGFSGFELGQKFPREPEALRKELSPHGLDLVSGWYSSLLLDRSVDQEIEAMQPHLKLLKAFDCNAMVFCEVSGCVHGDQALPVSTRPILSDSQWVLLLERLNAIGDYLASENIDMAYHHHMGTVIQSEEDVDRLMQGTSASVGLLIDTGHMTYAGGDPLALAQRWLDRIRHVHCKDIRPDVLADALNRNLSFLDAVLNGVFTVPGDGCVDYRTLFDKLVSVDYDGWLVVEAEQDPAIAHPLTYATLGYNNLKKFCEDTGLTVKP
jgi:inosose dehydratase